MAGSLKPGPLGQNPEVQDLNDGTMIRGLSPRPGPIGTKAASSASFHGRPSVPSPTTRTPRRKASQVELQALRQGSRGPQVQKLQRLLNARLTPSPSLAIAGVFGSLTHQAVLQYQKGASIAADGIVGKQTWYHLLKGDKAVRPSKIAPPPTVAVGVWEWPLEDKFAEALRRTAPKLPGRMRHEFEALLSPTSLGIMAGTLVVWAGSHAFGVGEVVDVALLVGGAFFLGMAIFDVAGELGDFLGVTSTATDAKDLDEAASHLARAIAIMGVAAFIALLAKIARGRGGAKPTESARPPRATEPVRSSSTAERPRASTPMSPKTPPPEPPSQTPQVHPHRQSISVPREPEPNRIRQLGVNHEQGGVTDLAEGLGGARYEQATGRRLSRSSQEGADFVDPEVGPISLKGPLVNKRTGQPVTINDEMVDGLAKSVIKDVQHNTYTNRVVVDTTGMSPAQRSRLQQTIDSELATNPGPRPKEIVFIE
jgi:Putative peptidoglycan binding domain